MKGGVIGANGLIVWTTPGVTVGLIITDGKVADCPPYVRRWAMGMDAHDLWHYGQSRNARLTWIPRGDLDDQR